jgi:hypothetical protein
MEQAGLGHPARFAFAPSIHTTPPKRNQGLEERQASADHDFLAIAVAK